MDIKEIRRKFPQYKDLSDSELADALHRKFYSDMPRAEFDAKIGVDSKAAPEGTRKNPWGAFGAASEAAADVFGFGDEISAGVFAAGESAVDALRGKGFKFGENYKRIYGDLDRMTAARERNYPAASLVGNIAGDVAAGGKLAQGGVTMAGRGVAPAMIEGGGYGGITGAGYARRGEKTEGAAVGALAGAGTAGVMHTLGGAISKAVTNRAANKARVGVPAKSADDLSAEASNLYAQMRASGASLPASEGARAKANIAMTLRGTNEKLAPMAFALKDQVDDVLGHGPVDIVAWHNLSKQVNRVARGNLQGDDAYYVGQIKKFVDKLRDGRVSGPPSAMDAWRKANELTIRQKKMEILDKALDFADLDTGQYTQAQLAHTIAKRFRQIYRNDAQRRQFSDAEQKIIRDIGQGKTAGAIIGALRRLAPRGIVSAGIGAGVFGSMFPGGIFVVPAVGEAAQRIADRNASRAAQVFSQDISRGLAPMPARIPNRLVPLIPGASAATGGQLPQR